MTFTRRFALRQDARAGDGTDPDLPDHERERRARKGLSGDVVVGSDLDVRPLDGRIRR
ncbi:hypothetical protein SAMN05428985_103110 [Nocardioides sp. YR527]|nr:hypothetical protein SAMN05428985_103110 [Nocardioides sp. YR527]